MFAVHGDLAHVKVVYDRSTGKSMGYGFVKFTTNEAAAAATAAINGMAIERKRIKVCRMLLLYLHQPGYCCYTYRKEGRYTMTLKGVHTLCLYSTITAVVDVYSCVENVFSGSVLKSICLTESSFAAQKVNDCTSEHML